MYLRYGFVDRPLVRSCNTCDRHSVANISFCTRSADVTISSREDERLTKMPILMFFAGSHVRVTLYTWLYSL
jgi:hypothetical protein